MIVSILFSTFCRKSAGSVAVLCRCRVGLALVGSLFLITLVGCATTDERITRMRMGEFQQTSHCIVAENHFSGVTLEELKWKAHYGDVAAQHAVGKIYSVGAYGEKPNMEWAREWWLKAAVQGCAPSQNNLSQLYAVGNGVPQDIGKAVEWWEKAAAQGYILAQANLQA